MGKGVRIDLDRIESIRTHAETRAREGVADMPAAMIAGKFGEEVDVAQVRSRLHGMTMDELRAVGMRAIGPGTPEEILGTG